MFGPHSHPVALWYNWVQYYVEEQKGKINYLGWTGRQDSDYSDDVHLVTVKFSWQDDDPLVEVKPMSTFLCAPCPSGDKLF